MSRPASEMLSRSKKEFDIESNTEKQSPSKLSWMDKLYDSDKFTSNDEPDTDMFSIDYSQLPALLFASSIEPTIKPG